MTLLLLWIGNDLTRPLRLSMAVALRVRSVSMPILTTSDIIHQTLYKPLHLAPKIWEVGQSGYQSGVGDWAKT
jgi:hypothetical protein